MKRIDKNADNKKYDIKKQGDFWYVFNPNGEEINTSRGFEFYIKEEQIAQILIKDLNELGEAKDDESNKKKVHYKESLIYWVLTNLLLDDTLDEIKIERKRLIVENNSEVKIELLTDTEILVIMLLEKYFNGAKDKSYAEWITGVKSTEDFILSWSQWLLPERSEKIKIKFNNLKKFLELERAVQVKFISYTVKYPSSKKDKKRIIQTFENADLLESRKEAIELVKMLKQVASNYKGIQLILNYIEKNSEGNFEKKAHKILTGNKMGTHKILPSLAFEAKLLESANKKFPKMVTNFDGNEFVSVNQGFSTLYYFASEF